MLDVNDYWDILIVNGVNEEVVNVVTCINGYSCETLDDIAYALYGCHVTDLLSVEVDDYVYEWFFNEVSGEARVLSGGEHTTFRDILIGDASCSDVLICDGKSGDEIYTIIAREAFRRI